MQCDRGFSNSAAVLLCQSHKDIMFWNRIDRSKANLLKAISHQIQRLQSNPGVSRIDVDTGQCDSPSRRLVLLCFNTILLNIQKIKYNIN